MGGKPGDPVAFDDDRAIMTGGVGIKYTFKKRRAELGVQLDASGNMSPERILALNHDNCPHSISRQVRQSPSQHVGSFRTQRRSPLGGKAPDRDPFKNLSQLFLKNHHYNDERYGEETLKDPCG